MTQNLQTERTTVRRLARRGSYDRELVYSILDEALICHVGFVVVCAGVLPLRIKPQAPVADERLAPGTPLPDYVERYRRPGW